MRVLSCCTFSMTISSPFSTGFFTLWRECRMWVLRGGERWEVGTGEVGEGVEGAEGEGVWGGGELG